MNCVIYNYNNEQKQNPSKMTCRCQISLPSIVKVFAPSGLFWRLKMGTANDTILLEEMKSDFY